MAAYQQYFDDIVGAVRWTMKRIYLLSLLLLACLVLPMKGQAVSQAELLNSGSISAHRL